MTEIPCPNCGELLACREQAIGRSVRCPRCRVLLRLDTDSEGRPACEWPRRRFPLLRLAFVVCVFLAGLGVGFVWGQSAASPSPGGVSATSFGVFSASNNVVVSEKRVVVPPPPPEKPAPPGVAGPEAPAGAR